MQRYVPSPPANCATVTSESAFPPPTPNMLPVGAMLPGDPSMVPFRVEWTDAAQDVALVSVPHPSLATVTIVNSTDQAQRWEYDLIVLPGSAGLTPPPSGYLPDYKRYPSRIWDCREQSGGSVATVPVPARTEVNLAVRWPTHDRFGSRVAAGRYQVYLVGRLPGISGYSYPATAVYD